MELFYFFSILLVFQEQENAVHSELIELRNSMTLAFFMLNAMFVVIMFTLQLQVYKVFQSTFLLEFLVN